MSVAIVHFMIDKCFWWFRDHGRLLFSSKLEMVAHGSPVTLPTAPQTVRSSRWTSLKLYLVRIFSFYIVHDWRNFHSKCFWPYSCLHPPTYFSQVGHKCCDSSIFPWNLKCVGRNLNRQNFLALENGNGIPCSMSIRQHTFEPYSIPIHMVSYDCFPYYNIFILSEVVWLFILF
jgi:hypothetical protein